MFKVNQYSYREEKVNKTFRFPTELLEKLQTVAQHENVSLNKLVVRCCEYAMENLEPESDS